MAKSTFSVLYSSSCFKIAAKSLIVEKLVLEQDEFLKGRAHKSNSKGKSKDLIKCVKCYTRTFL